MKTIIYLLFFICTYNNSFSQKTKSFEIVKSQIVYVSGIVSFNESGNPTDTLYYMFAKDYRYQYNIEMFSVRSGTIKEIYSFLKYCLAFIEKEDEGTSETKEGNSLHVSKTMGMKGLYIYGAEKYDRSYCIVGPSHLKKYIASIESWALKNNVSIK
jgi:hypothetical protein